MGIGLHNLKRNAGANRPSKRRGQGPGSGNGKTAGRGYKGQRSRSGYSHKIGFEGGQMPLYRRLPKVGFTNIFKKEWQVVNLESLEKLFEAGATIDKKALKEVGLVKDALKPVKILGKGKVTKAFMVTADGFSETAHKAIVKAGGKIEKP